jgi:hypothetical protein
MKTTKKKMAKKSDRRAPFDPIQEGKWSVAAAGSWMPLWCSND